MQFLTYLGENAISLVAFMIKDWNQELTPWPAPPVFGKIPFGRGAIDTLEFVINQLLPVVQEDTPILGIRQVQFPGHLVREEEGFIFSCGKAHCIGCDSYHHHHYQGKHFLHNLCLLFVKGLNIFVSDK